MEINKINASEINLVWQNTNPEDSRTDANERGLSVLDVSRQVQFCLRALICASVPCKKKKLLFSAVADYLIYCYPCVFLR